MDDGKLRVKDIEGSKDNVINFFKEQGLDVCDYLHTTKEIKIPLISIIIVSILFMMCLTLIMIFGENTILVKILTIFALALGFINISLIYMSWKNCTLTGIIAFGELIIFAVTLNIYTPKEVIKKIEDKVPSFFESNSK